MALSAASQNFWERDYRGERSRRREATAALKPHAPRGRRQCETTLGAFCRVGLKHATNLKNLADFIWRAVDYGVIGPDYELSCRAMASFVNSRPAVDLYAVSHNDCAATENRHPTASLKLVEGSAQLVRLFRSHLRFHPARVIAQFCRRVSIRLHPLPYFLRRHL